MGLGLQTESGGGGNYADVVKFDARAGRMFRVDRVEGATGWETNNVEITADFKALIDLDNIQVGWLLFQAGVAPDMTMVKIGEPMPPRPSDQHKQGFKVMMKLAKSCGGDVREMAATAKSIIGAVDRLHEAYTAQKAANPGKLPLVALTGSTPIVSTGKGQTSTNYAPVFEIAGWLPRPADLGGDATETVAAPPAPAPTPAPAKAPAAENFDTEF
jgi:hypothetical protein